jgi:hypothetical protein
MRGVTLKFKEKNNIKIEARFNTFPSADGEIERGESSIHKEGG